MLRSTFRSNASRRHGLDSIPFTSPSQLSVSFDYSFVCRAVSSHRASDRGESTSATHSTETAFRRFFAIHPPKLETTFASSKLQILQVPRNFFFFFFFYARHARAEQRLPCDPLSTKHSHLYGRNDIVRRALGSSEKQCVPGSAGLFEQCLIGETIETIRDPGACHLSRTNMHYDRTVGSRTRGGTSSYFFFLSFFYSSFLSFFFFFLRRSTMLYCEQQSRRQ